VTGRHCQWAHCSRLSQTLTRSKQLEVVSESLSCGTLTALEALPGQAQGLPVPVSGGSESESATGPQADSGFESDSESLALPA